MDAQRLVALNHGSYRTPIPGREQTVVIDKCRRWAAATGVIKLEGSSDNPRISLQLTDVDTDRIIEQAQAEQWRVIIDFPFDQPPHGPRSDLSRLQQFRNENEEGYRTLVWIPSFLNHDALKELGRLVILDHILTGERFDQYVSHLSPADKASAKSLLDTQQKQLRAKMAAQKYIVAEADSPLAIRERLIAAEAAGQRLVLLTPLETQTLGAATLHPVLLIVLDGMSFAVFRELPKDFATHGEFLFATPSRRPAPHRQFVGLAGPPTAPGEQHRPHSGRPPCAAARPDSRRKDGGSVLSGSIPDAGRELGRIEHSVALPAQGAA